VPDDRWLRYDLQLGTMGAAMRDFLPAVRRMTLTHDDTCSGVNC